MEWLRRMFGKSRQAQKISHDASILAREIWEAHKELRIAEQKLSEAVKPDQIDYAIYMTEAAEKRLNMLIREAREQQLELSELVVKGYEPKNNTRNM
jgi:hypothetical protein